MFICLSVSVWLSSHYSLHLSVHLTLYFFLLQSVSLSICPSFCLHLFEGSCMDRYLSFCPYVCAFVHISIDPFFNHSVCLSVWLSIQSSLLFVCPSAYLFLSIYLTFHPFCPTSFCSFKHLPIHPFFHLSVCLFIGLSILMSVHLPICLCSYPSVRLFICLPTRENV